MQVPSGADIRTLMMKAGATGYAAYPLSYLSGDMQLARCIFYSPGSVCIASGALQISIFSPFYGPLALASRRGQGRGTHILLESWRLGYAYCMSGYVSITLLEEAPWDPFPHHFRVFVCSTNRFLSTYRRWRDPPPRRARNIPV